MQELVSGQPDGAENPLYQAAGPSEPCIKHFDENVLTVTGKIVTRVLHLGQSLWKSVSGPDPATKLQRERIDKLKECYQLSSTCTQYPTGKDHIRACRQTLTVGMGDNNRQAVPESTEFAFEMWEWWAELTATLQDLADATVSAASADLDRWGKYVMGLNAKLTHIHLGKHFATTVDKYMATVPDGTEPGDLISIMLGCATPFIVREDAGRYILVGECYVHGLMHGEAMEMEQRKLQEIEFK